MLKTSPLCSRDDGRVIFFTARWQDAKYRLTAPRELLDDACGSATPESARKTWVAANKDAILAKLTSGAVRAPFDQILVEEIS